MFQMKIEDSILRSPFYDSTILYVERERRTCFNISFSDIKIQIVTWSFLKNKNKISSVISINCLFTFNSFREKNSQNEK